MKLSACYIIGEYEAVFEKSLQSLKTQVDELIVISTQGNQKAEELVRKYGGKVFSFFWQEDFAAARNFALAKASGDWIVFLDADEYFPQQFDGKLRSCIEKNRKSIADLDQIFIKRLDIDSENNNEILASFFVAKIFRNTKDLLYKGRIHEELYCKNSRELKSAFINEEEIFIYHTGYSESLGPQKAARNLKILLEEEESNVRPEELYMYIAEAYEGVGNLAMAIEYASLDVKMNHRRPITYASRSYRLLFRLLNPDSQAAIERLLCIAEMAIKDFPELPEFWAQYATYLAQDFRYDEAIGMMGKAMQCFEDYDSIEPSDFSTADKSIGMQLMINWQKLQALESSLRISACVIAKNEAEELPSWIENMKQCSDEQILIDTGSEDDTVKIAQNAGVKVFYQSWNGDFSQVRNAALEQATGDWIVFLDADEYFSKDTVRNVRHVVAREHLRINEVDAIFCPIVNIDVDDNGREIQRFINVRLFRNLPELRYQGVVHESVRRDSGALRVLTEKHKLLIYHTGYSSKRIMRKLQRNLTLLQNDIVENGEGIQHYRYLADCYYGLGEYKKAIDYAKKHIASPVVSFSNDADVYRKLIFSKQELLVSIKNILNDVDNAIQEFPQLPDFYAIKGFLFYQNGKIRLAEQWLSQALQIYERYSSFQTQATMFEMDLPKIQNLLSQIKQKKSFGGFLTEIQWKQILESGVDFDAPNECVQHIAIRWQDVFRTAFYILMKASGVTINRPSLLQRCKNILPENIYNCLLRYVGYIDCLGQIDYDGHRSLYQLAIHDQDILFVKYLDACHDFSVEQNKEILQKIFKDGFIVCAEKMLFSLPKGKIDGEILYYRGICCYEQGKLNEAKTYFVKIKNENAYKAGAESYLYWIKEREDSK